MVYILSPVVDDSKERKKERKKEGKKERKKEGLTTDVLLIQA